MQRSFPTTFHSVLSRIMRSHSQAPLFLQVVSQHSEIGGLPFNTEFLSVLATFYPLALAFLSILCTIYIFSVLHPFGSSFLYFKIYTTKPKNVLIFNPTLSIQVVLLYNFNSFGYHQHQLI